jgi:hypothetical protein
LPICSFYNKKWSRLAAIIATGIASNLMGNTENKVSFFVKKLLK